MSESKVVIKKRNIGTLTGSISSVIAGVVAGTYSAVRVGLAGVGTFVGGAGNFLRNVSGTVIASAMTGFANFFGAIWGASSVTVNKSFEGLEKAFAFTKEVFNIIQKALAALTSGLSAYIITPVWNNMITPVIVGLRTVLSVVAGISWSIIRNASGYAIGGLTYLTARAIAIITGLTAGVADGLRKLVAVGAGLTLEGLNIVRKGIGLAVAVLNTIRNVLQNTVISWVVAPLIAATYTISKHLFKTSAYLLLEALQLIRMGLSAFVASLALILNRVGQMIAYINSWARVFSGILLAAVVMFSTLVVRGLNLFVGLLAALGHFLWNNIAARLFAVSMVIANLVRQFIGGVTAVLIYGLNLLVSPIAFFLKGLLHTVYNFLVFGLYLVYAGLLKLIGGVVGLGAEALNLAVKLLGLSIAVCSFVLTFLQNYILAPIAALTSGILHGLKFLTKYLVEGLIDGLKLGRIALAFAVSVIAVPIYRVLNFAVCVLAEAVSFSLKGLGLIGSTLFSLAYWGLGGGWEGCKAFFWQGWNYFDIIKSFGGWLTPITSQQPIIKQINMTFEALAGQLPFESELIRAHQVVLANMNFTQTVKDTYKTFSNQDSEWEVAKAVFKSVAGQNDIGSLFTPIRQQIAGDLSFIQTLYNQLKFIEPLSQSFSNIAENTHRPELLSSIYQFFGGSTDIKQVYNQTVDNTALPSSSIETGKRVYNALNPTNDIQQTGRNVFNIVAGPKTLAKNWQEFKAQFRGDAITKSFNYVYQPLANPENFGQSLKQISWSRFTSDLILNCWDAKDAFTDAQTAKETFKATMSTVGGNDNIASVLPKVFESIGGSESPWHFAKKAHDAVASIGDTFAKSVVDAIAGRKDFITQAIETYQLLNHPGVLEFYSQLEVNHPLSEIYDSIYATLNGNNDIGSYLNKLPQRAAAKAIFMQSFSQIGGEESLKLFHKINNSSFFGKEAYLDQQVAEPLFYQLLDDKTPKDFTVDSFYGTREYTDRLFSGTFGKIQGLGMFVGAIFAYIPWGFYSGLKNNGVPGAIVGLFNALYKIVTLPFRNIHRNLELLEMPTKENNGAWDMMSRDMDQLENSRFQAWSVFNNDYDQGYNKIVDGPDPVGEGSSVSLLKGLGYQVQPQREEIPANDMAYAPLFDSEQPIADQARFVLK